MKPRALHRGLRVPSGTLPTAIVLLASASTGCSGSATPPGSDASADAARDSALDALLDAPNDAAADARSDASNDQQPAAPPLVLISSGHTDYVIVLGDNPTAAERFAASELAAFVAQSTGVALPIVSETEHPTGRAIYLGQTAFASAHGVPVASLAAEEWLLRASGDAVIVSGGRPRGTLYAVYELLERFAGVRFFTPERTQVTHASQLAVPSNLALRAHPAFAMRTVFMLAGGDGDDAHNLYRVRRRLTTNATEYPLDPRYGDTLFYGRPYSTHTHHFYTADFPADHPEYFALLPDGTRGPNGPGGQVDMTNTDVRRLFAEKLRQYILADRADAASAGLPPPTLYDLTPNDNENRCTCPNCTALATRYGSYAGVVIDFTNDIASQIAAEFPDVTVSTSAYTFYADAPHGIAPRANVLVKVAQLGGEWWTLPQRDTLRSMNHPLNADAASMLGAWASLGSALGVHDYWTAWNQQFQWPHANVHGLAETLALYAQRGVRNVFVEDELFGTRLHNFVDLQLYVASHVLEDPAASVDPLVDEFTNGVYGPAAAPMRQLLNLIERRQGEEHGVLATVQPGDRAYYDPAFFRDADALLTDAEQRAQGDADALRDVGQERLAFDETMLYLWDSLAARAGGAWNFDRATVLDRLQAGYTAAYAKYGGWGSAMRTDDDARIAFLRNPPPLPAQFAGQRVFDLVGPGLQLGSGGPALRVADADAAAGEAWRLDATLGGAAGDQSQAPTLGTYDAGSGQIVTYTIAPVPTDERYHLYRIATVRAAPALAFWAHHSWWLSQQLALAMQGGLAVQRTFDVYASVKLEGPSYVPGSSRVDAFSVDRVLLVVAP